MTVAAPQEPEPSPPRSLGRAEKAVLGCCAATVLLCFAPWYSVDMEVPVGFPGHNSWQGVDSWHGVLVFLCSLAAAGGVLVERSPAVGISRSTARLAAFGCCAFACLVVVIYIASVDNAAWMSMEAGKTIWPYVVLAATGVAAYFAFKRLGWFPRVDPEDGGAGG